MRPTRILGIAPYEGMRSLMVQLASSMEDVELTALVGDLEPGAALLEQYPPDAFDVIISRGGTAEIIRQKTTLPVVDIELSIYDILRSIRLAESSNNRYALVGFPAITRNAFFLCDVLRYNIDLYTIHDESEARKVLKKLAAEKCPMVLCDMITNSIAHEFGLPALLIISGSESVEAAIRQAVNINQLFLPLRAHDHLLEAVLHAQNNHLIVLDDKKQIVYRSATTPPSSMLQDRLSDLVPSVLAEGSRHVAVTLKGQAYTIHGKAIVVEDKKCVVFSLQPHAARSTVEKYGIRFLNKEEVFDHFFNSFYGITQPENIQHFAQFSKSFKPVMIVGALGTGKDQMARLLYGNGPFQNMPICLIDCALLQQKGWNYLIHHEDSPLTESGITVHFRNTRSLTDEQFLYLFSLLKDIHYHRRNQLIFTTSLNEGSGLTSRAQHLISWFDCVTLHLPRLCSHREDIPHLASLYISSLNMHNAKEIVGIDNEGLALLQDYEWPDNYDQFKRVLQELVLTASSPYIHADSIRAQLAQERLMYPSLPAQSLASFINGKTLEEINMMVMQHVLAQENGNRTSAAAKLGISRTSLWRMMQKSGISDNSTDTESSH